MIKYQKYFHMLYEKGERNVNPEIIKRNIESIIANEDACYIALDGNHIIGFIIAVRGKFIGIITLFKRG